MGESARKQPASAERNGRVVRRAVEEIWNAGDLAVANALFTDSYLNHGGLIPDVVLGPEAIKVAVALHRTAFPDLWVTVEHLVAEGEMAALRWVARRKPRDGPIDLAPDAPSGALAGMTFCRFADGKIAESWTSWGAGDVLRQLVESVTVVPDSAATRRALN